MFRFEEVTYLVQRNMKRKFKERWQTFKGLTQTKIKAKQESQPQSLLSPSVPDPYTVKKAVELLDAPSKNTFLKSNKNNS